MHRGTVTADLLLDAALAVYAASGEQGFTVGAVTRTSGVSLGSLYHHFGSLDGLFAALTHRWQGRLLDELATALRDARTARSGIDALVRAYLAFVQRNPGPALILHSAVADRHGMEQGQELRDTQEARVAELARWIQPCIESGELAPLPRR